MNFLSILSSIFLVGTAIPEESIREVLPEAIPYQELLQDPSQSEARTANLHVSIWRGWSETRDGESVVEIEDLCLMNVEVPVYTESPSTSMNKNEPQTETCEVELLLEGNEDLNLDMNVRAWMHEQNSGIVEESLDKALMITWDSISIDSQKRLWRSANLSHATGKSIERLGGTMSPGASFKVNWNLVDDSYLGLSFYLIDEE